MTIAKQIILDELIENSHPILVETVIYEALYDYYKNKDKTFNSAIAYAICKRIDEAEEKGISEAIMNPEIISKISKY